MATRSPESYEDQLARTDRPQELRSSLWAALRAIRGPSTPELIGRYDEVKTQFAMNDLIEVLSARADGGDQVALDWFDVPRSYRVR